MTRRFVQFFGMRFEPFRQLLCDVLFPFTEQNKITKHDFELLRQNYPSREKMAQIRGKLR